MAELKKRRNEKSKFEIREAKREVRKHGSQTRKSAGWELRLYITNRTAPSMLAQDNLRSFCQQYLPHQCDLRIIDVVKQPELASQNDIVAIPTLVRVRPYPKKTLIGTLSDARAVLTAFGLVPRTGNAVGSPA